MYSKAWALSTSPDGNLVALCHAATGDSQQLLHARLSVYESLTGRLVSTLALGQADVYRWKWAPCSSRIGVTGQRCESRPSGQLAQSAALHEAATMRCIGPSWTPAALSVISAASSMVLAPDCSLLLCLCRSDVKRQWMHILNMHDGSLIASADLFGHHDCHCIGGHGNSAFYYHVNVLWHPSSYGLVLSECIWRIVDAQPLQQARLTLGFCSQPAHLGELSAFSPSGEHLMAQWRSDRASYKHKFPCQLAILRCAQQQGEYSLTVLYLPEQPMPEAPALWCPLLAPAEALLMDSGGTLRVVLPSGEPAGEPSPPNLRMRSGLSSFSPCGRFCQVFCRRDGIVSYILDCGTGLILVSIQNPKSLKWTWPASGSCILTHNWWPGVSSRQLRPFEVLRYRPSE